MAVRFDLPERSLFLRKTALVFVIPFALVPVVGAKGDVPALFYAGGLVVLHLFVLGAYLYRVRFRELDPDRRALAARLLALGAVIYVMLAVSSFEEGTPLSRLALQMFGVWILHTLVLLLLMGRVRYAVPDSDDLAPAADRGPEQ